MVDTLSASTQETREQRAGAAAHLFRSRRCEGRIFNQHSSGRAQCIECRHGGATLEKNDQPISRCRRSTWRTRVLRRFGETDRRNVVSRIDLAADFSSPCVMDSWHRSAWVTRAVEIHSYAKDQQFTGWTVGMGGIIGARLYDKTREIAHSGKDWATELWRPAGWEPGQGVWRLEFEFKRDTPQAAQFELARQRPGQPQWTLELRHHRMAAADRTQPQRRHPRPMAYPSALAGTGRCRLADLRRCIAQAL